MTNEEMQKTIEFILEHQAQFTADLQLLTSKVDKLAEAQTRSEARLSRLEESFVLLVQLARNTDDRMDTLTQRIDTLTQKVEILAEAQTRTESRMAELTKAQAHTESRMVELAEAQVHTGEKLNDFIKTIERYINESRNGKTP